MSVVSFDSSSDASSGENVRRLKERFPFDGKLTKGVKFEETGASFYEVKSMFKLLCLTSAPFGEALPVSVSGRFRKECFSYKLNVPTELTSKEHKRFLESWWDIRKLDMLWQLRL